MAGPPFLTLEGFAAEYGALSDGESATAERLLTAVSDYIRLLKPDADTLAAQQVVFEVTRDAIRYGPYERLEKFENETSRRREVGQFAGRPDDLLTNRHQVMLRIVAGNPVGARGSFTAGDY